MATRLSATVVCLAVLSGACASGGVTSRASDEHPRPDGAPLGETHQHTPLSVADKDSHARAALPGGANGADAEARGEASPPNASTGNVAPTEGLYQYELRGTFTYGSAERMIDAVRRLQIREIGDGRWVYHSQDAEEDQEATIGFTSQGIVLVALRSTSALVVFDFEPSEVVVTAPVQLEPSASWSFRLESTDGCYRQDVDRHVLARNADAERSVAEVWNLEEIIRISTIGSASCIPVSLTVDRNATYAARHMVELAFHEVAEGTLGGAAVSADRRGRLVAAPVRELQEVGGNTN